MLKVIAGCLFSNFNTIYLWNHKTRTLPESTDQPTGHSSGNPPHWDEMWEFYQTVCKLMVLVYWQPGPQFHNHYVLTYTWTESSGPELSLPIVQGIWKKEYGGTGILEMGGGIGGHIRISRDTRDGLNGGQYMIQRHQNSVPSSHLISSYIEHTHTIFPNIWSHWHFPRIDWCRQLHDFSWPGSITYSHPVSMLRKAELLCFMESIWMQPQVRHSVLHRPTTIWLHCFTTRQLLGVLH